MLTARGGGSFASVLARGGSLSSSAQRMLPPDFLERTTHSLTDEVELEVVWGSSWMIPLVRNERGDVFFEKQKWCEFVDDNCLTHANFVVFEHKRDNYLFVIIFGEDGSQIMENPIRSCCTSPADSP